MDTSRFTVQIWRRLRNVFAVLGALAVLAGGYAVVRQGRPRPASLKQKLTALTARATKGTALENLLAPGDMHKGHVFTGALKKGHPRVLFPSAATYGQLRARYQSDKQYQKMVDTQTKGQGLYNAVVAWVCGGDREAGRRAIAGLLSQEIKEPSDTGDGPNATLDFALAYDLTGNLPDWNDAERARVEQKLADYVRAGLKVLDGKSASLWHSRAALSSAVWVAAVVLDGPFPDLPDLRRRAQSHFLATLDAAALSEGWPEGYTYWINGRAFLLAAAGAAQINGVTEAPELNRRVLSVLTRIGQWTIHGTEPGGRFYLFGDSGPRNDLQDETQRVVDLLALLTDSLVLKDYSRYLAGNKKGYHPPYRWAIPLLRGPAERDFAPSEVLKDLSSFDGHIKPSDIFGKDSLGQVFIRSDWSADATFISFQAGHALTHHGHYQAGHFTIFKKAPLAITSGNYGKFFGEERLNYFIRTVAANSLLVLKPGEKVQPNRFFKDNVADGGQRITMPTGSAVLSVENWKENLHARQHFEGGRITAFANADPRFVSVASDLTGAYNNSRYDDNGGKGKVSDVSRQMIYLARDDVLLVHDRVVATDAAYTKKWLLHSWGRPETATEKVLVGSPDNGILESADARVHIANGEGELDVLRLLPEDAVIRKVGGPGYRYYVETDGDDTVLDGRNMAEGAREESWFDSGMWRIEIQPAGKRRDDRFLVALAPGIKGKGSGKKLAVLPAEGAAAVLTPAAVLAFADDRRIRYESPAGEQRLHVVAGFPAEKQVRISVAGEAPTVKTTGEGALAFETAAGPAREVVLERLD